MMTGWRTASGLLLPLVPTLAVFGNILVIIAVYREKCLQTVTNMLIVSLAISDFLRNDFKWSIGQFLCNLYLAFDVTCSTASILNLLAISLDRYIAISHPLCYAQYGARGGRAMISISIVWILSVVVGLPILLGVNPMEKSQCELGNAYFNILSSLLSFFLPCTAMIVLYTVIFRRLRQRGKARSLRQVTKIENGKINSALVGGAKMAHELGKHFRNRTEKILFRISLQTSSLPTFSDSLEDIPTMSPFTNHVCFGSTTIFNIKTCGATTIGCKESSWQLPLKNKDSYSSNADENFADQKFHMQQTNCNGSKILRAYGETFNEIIPYIDSVSCMSSSQSLSKEMRTEDINMDFSVPITRSLDMTLRDVKHIENSPTKTCINISSEARNEGIDSTSSSSTIAVSLNNPILFGNGEHRQKNEQMRKESYNGTNNIELESNEDVSFADYVRVYKGQLWKRMTNGWQARPSRQLVKKATKQMRRERKATVTLAVVLAVFLFCWLPFFTLHLTNSICLISARENGCMGVLPLFLTTWLGYINSSLNPLIYTVFDQRFRNAFRAILCCGISRR
ncbi:7 transmembrane receptor [Dictyocaulus viviparus]|uniref:7 transmembrane receptor n=1 Tax=Dictyocaulus viviparus TaxID=29172 RepID=A0A0D8XC13_DICVI|nr:7 transmembrane receptor [Dictyocaulus viviparus]